MAVSYVGSIYVIILRVGMSILLLFQVCRNLVGDAKEY